MRKMTRYKYRIHGRGLTPIYHKSHYVELLYKYQKPTYMAEIETDVRTADYQYIIRATKELLKLGLIEITNDKKKKTKYALTQKGVKFLELYNHYINLEIEMEKLVHGYCDVLVVK